MFYSHQIQTISVYLLNDFEYFDLYVLPKIDYSVFNENFSFHEIIQVLYNNIV